jgi:hypothetical protein
MIILASPIELINSRLLARELDNYSEPLRSQLHYTMSWGTIHELVQRLTLD